MLYVKSHCVRVDTLSVVSLPVKSRCVCRHDAAIDDLHHQLGLISTVSIIHTCLILLCQARTLPQWHTEKLFSAG